MYILIFLLFSILFSPLGHTQTAQDILEENLDSVSYSSDREINNYEFIKSLIESLEVQDLLCPKKSTTENCIKAGLKKINKNAYKNKTIDEITYKGFKELIKTISYKDNQLELIPPKKLNKKQTTLGSFSGYLKTKNFFEEKRKQDELHLAILDKLNKKYRRKLKPLGKVRVEEYAYHEYSRFQIVALSNLMKEVIEYPVSKIGYLYLFNKDFERIKREIEAQEFLIDGYLERYYEAEEESQEREELKLKIQSLREDLLSLREELILDNLRKELEQVNNELDLQRELLLNSPSYDEEEVFYESVQGLKLKKLELENKIAKESITRELAPGDVYQFLLNELEIKLAKLPSTKEFKSKNPTVGDAVVAYYLSGAIDSEAMSKVLTLTEINEKYQTLGNVSLKVVESVGRIFLIANPVTSPYAIFTFIMMDSFRNIKKMKKEKANESHLIR